MWSVFDKLRWMSYHVSYTETETKSPGTDGEEGDYFVIMVCNVSCSSRPGPDLFGPLYASK